MIVFYTPRDRVSGFEPVSFTTKAVAQEWINGHSHPERWRVAENHVWSSLGEYIAYIQTGEVK